MNANDLDAVLAHAHATADCPVGSLNELVSWVLADQERIDAVSQENLDALSRMLNLPKRLIHAILYSRPFIHTLMDRLHLRFVSPKELHEIYGVILRQLKDPEVSLGAKRSMLEYLVRQAGLDKPRKLSIKQQSEVVVRLGEEYLQPAQVLEALGVRPDVLEAIDEKALPQAHRAPSIEVDYAFAESGSSGREGDGGDS